MFEQYKNRMAYRGSNMSEMLRVQSNMVIEQTWDRDPNYRRVYVVKVDSGLPKVTELHELVDVKFNVETYQRLTSDEPAYLLQFRHGAEKHNPDIAVGSYVYMEDEDGDWKWWLLVALDERPQFRQYHILEANWTLKWIVDNKIYSCLAVQRYQNSYSSGLQSGSRITGVDDMTAIWVPTNVSTQTIGYNQRFLISDIGRTPALCYEVSKISDTSPVGLIKFTLKQDEFNSQTDNVDLMIADYWTSSVEPTVSDVNEELVGDAAITYSGTTATIKVGGSFKTFTPAFRNESVTVDKWTVSDENGDISGDTENYTIKYSGDKLQLKVALNYNLIGKILMIQLIGSDKSVAQLSVGVV
jgi:hypothetical protein